MNEEKLHLHQCGWCGEYYTGSRVDHGCPPEPISAMEQDYIDSFDVPVNGTCDALFTDKALDAEMRLRCADDEIEPPTYDGMWK